MDVMQSSAPSAPLGNDASGQAQDSTASDYIKELSGKVNSLSSERDELRGNVDRTSKTLERLQAALKDETVDAQEDDETKDQRLMDMFLDAALEDQKKGGSGMPLTTKLAMETVALKKMLREIKTEMAKFGETQKITNSPEFKYDEKAFAEIDMKVQDSIASIYGGVDEHLFEAVSKDIGKEIARLKRESPKVWEEIRRNPEYLDRMAKHFVEKKIPPKAREMLQSEKERNTPMTLNELKQAFREADSIKDPKARAEIKSAIRTKILEETYNKR